MYSLFIYLEQDNSNHIIKTDLIQYLINHSFIKLKQNNIYTPGGKFMNLITFMGCSPTIDHEIQTEISFNFSDDLMFVGGKSIQKLICPNCKNTLIDTEEIVTKFNHNDVILTSCCQKNISFNHINWRKSAAQSKVFIQISNIFPNEGIPSEDLITLLSNFSKSKWSYFYSKLQNF